MLLQYKRTGINHTLSSKAVAGEGRIERRLTLLFIATGGSFGFIATIIGALYLLALSGVSLGINFGIYESHPYLQIFGFVSEFVIGVAYSILPLFKSKKRTSLALPYSNYVLIAIANIVLLFSAVTNASALEFELGAVLIIGSAIIFAYETIKILGRPSIFLAEAEPFMALSVIAFVLLAIQLLLEYLDGREPFSPEFLYLSLIGFTGSMIYGVELRTITFRMARYRKHVAILAFILQACSVALIFLAGFAEQSIFEAIASVLFLGAAISFAISIRIFEKRRTVLSLGSAVSSPSAASHNTISRYTAICTVSSSSWVLFASLLGVVWLEFHNSSFAVRDSFIHAAAIGFIGSAIITFGPVLLPGVLSKKAPSKELDLWPLILVNAALILRVLGNFYSLATVSGLPIWESISGLLILVAMVWFMKGLHFKI